MFTYGGAEEDRTLYLLNANQALSQVSYSPEVYRNNGEYPLRRNRQMVGKTGFEPATLCSQNRCTTKLCYFPLNGALSKNRTRNLQIRSLTLYPVELLARFSSIIYT